MYLLITLPPVKSRWSRNSLSRYRAIQGHLDLIAQKPMNLLAIVDEQSKFPKVLTNCHPNIAATQDTFVHPFLPFELISRMKSKCTCTHRAHAMNLCSI